ncbi:MAG: GNAT family acetyltransferase [Calditrichaceae bacterium]
MENLVIRSYQHSDKENIIKLWGDCDLIVSWNNPEKDIARKLKVNPEWFLIGELNGQIVASCMVGYEGHRGWINYLAVDPKYQRKGIASKMMAEAENILRSTGCAKINLQVREINPDVVKFYESIGYKVEPMVNMGKRLENDE